MTLEDLIAELQDMLEENPELADQEVRIAIQPNYPLAATIANITALESDDDDELTVWIATNEATEYGTKEAWN